MNTTSSGGTCAGLFDTTMKGKNMEISRKSNRRTFLKRVASLTAIVSVSQWMKPFSGYITRMLPATADESRSLVVVKGSSMSKSGMEKMVQKGLAQMGGLDRFVKRGMKVVVKPNLGFNSSPERAHTTHPYLVEAVAKMCKALGADVKIMDRPVHNARLVYKTSGMVEAADNAGVDLVYMDGRKYRRVDVPGGMNLRNLKVYSDILEADVIINMPIAKDHSSARLTLAMKNLMGVIGGNRGVYHLGLHKNIVDFTKTVPVQLVILDATRVLVDHGPSSGRPSDIKHPKSIVLGTNPVAVDAYSSQTFFGISPSRIDYLKYASREGMGEINIRNMNVKRILV